MKHLFCINGRWMTMATAARCVHHIALADSCGACATTGRLEDFSDDMLRAECDRRRLFVPVVVEAPKVVEKALEPAPIVEMEPKPTPPVSPKRGRK